MNKNGQCSGPDGRYALRTPGAVRAQRVWDRLMALGRIGDTGDGGVNRQAMTAGDVEAHCLVAGWAAAAGASAAMDEAGNLFLSLKGQRRGEGDVLFGSHLDTQPTGGRFDGAYGVVAGLEVLAAWHDCGMAPPRDLSLVVWNNEEGCRYAPTTFGSGVGSGVLDLAALLGQRDRDGICLDDELARLRAAYPRARPSARHRAYIEAHIEQGPLLEGAGLVIGAVSGIQALRQYSVTVPGQPAHAGTTPRRFRLDALRTAAVLMNRLYALTDDAEDLLRFTIGRVETMPGAINTVPAACRFSIDLRHPDDDVLDRIEALLLGEADAAGATVAHLIATPATAFDAALVGLVEWSALELGLGVMRLPSGATHDAIHMARLCPTAMIFVPCRGGVSHSPAEHAEPAHLAMGAQVLASVVEQLAAAD